MTVTVEMLVKRADKLQPPPAVLGRLLEIVSTEDYAFSDIERVIRVDASASASVLRAANSPRFKRGSSNGSLAMAISLVGKTELVRLILGQAAKCMRVDSVAGYELNGGGLWQATIRSAVAAELIAKQTGLSPPGVAYAAGLLLDVGKLVLGDQLCRCREEIATRAELHPDEGFDVIEQHVIGVDHAEIGALIAERWDLPSSIVAAIRYHHRPNEAPEHQELAYVVHLAAAISVINGSSAGIDGLRYCMAKDWAQRVPMDQSDVEFLVVQVEQEVEKVQMLVEQEGS